MKEIIHKTAETASTSKAISLGKVPRKGASMSKFKEKIKPLKRNSRKEDSLAPGNHLSTIRVGRLLRVILDEIMRDTSVGIRVSSEFLLAFKDYVANIYRSRLSKAIRAAAHRSRYFTWDKSTDTFIVKPNRPLDGYDFRLTNSDMISSYQTCDVL